MPKARTPLDYDRYQELHAQGLSLRQIAKELGIPESTLPDNLKMMQKAQASHGLPHLLTLSTGETVDRKRQRYQARREGLQRHGTRSARRRLRHLAGKQARFQHAPQTIRSPNDSWTERNAPVRPSDWKTSPVSAPGLRPDARSDHDTPIGDFFNCGSMSRTRRPSPGCWLILVDPRHTSQECSHCGHIAKANRPTQDRFSCQRCGYTTGADFNAAQNIQTRAAVKQRIVAQPGVRELFI